MFEGESPYSKKQYMLHDENMYLKKTPDKLGHKTIYTGGHCTSEGCVLECAFWPKIGFLSENGNPYYDDVNLMVSFYGLGF